MNNLENLVINFVLFGGWYVFIIKIFWLYFNLDILIRFIFRLENFVGLIIFDDDSEVFIVVNVLLLILLIWLCLKILYLVGRIL